MTESKELTYGQVGDYERTDYDEPVFAAIDRMCQKYPDRPAIIYLGETWTYAEMTDIIDRFANVLCHLGVRQGDRVMLYIPNSPQFIAGYFGAMKAGATPVPVSPIYTPFEIEYLINDSGAGIILCQDTNCGYVREVFPKTTLRGIIVTNYADLLPWWKRAAGVMFDKIPHGVVEKGKEIYQFKDLMKQSPPDPPKVEINPRADLSRLLYTGGTTGFPKGVPTNHTAVVSFVSEVRQISEGFVGEGGEDRLIMINPLFHEMAQGMTMAWGLTKGNPVVLMPIADIDAILDTIERYQITLLLGVPTLYRMILEHDRAGLYDCKSLRLCLCGADKLPPEVNARWREMFHRPIFQCYGATEVGFTTTSPFDQEPHPESIGIPLPSREVKVVDPDTLEPLPENEVGEVLVRCEYTFKHYWNKPEETARSFVPMAGQVFYRMNDFARKGDDGQLYFVDRGVDIIKYKGYRVSASEIEAVLQDHPAVIAACVVGVPDARTGERIKGIVVLKDDARGVSSPELASWCRRRLAPYKVPKYIEFRDMLPKSKVGKLLRREIRDEERRKTQKRADKKI
ncbi:MAG: AMP-binding protein [Proteobacteria bacterium]|nr:AMP-binding protein [Pseudomonadota bacterium]NIS71659.1 AMP-binding protein [Pseudomonadota bacterium]